MGHLLTKIGFSIGLLLALGFAVSAQAERSRVFSSAGQSTQLLELFTSQGCSSCPPADRWLTQWKQKPELWSQLIPVAFHVDYWDWMGWRDRFATKDFGERQRLYKKEGAVRSVYTPGFVVDGQEWRGWFDGKPLPATAPKQGTLSATIKRHRIQLQYQPELTPGNSTGTKRDWVVHVTLLGFDLQTPVQRGENSDRTLQEDFVVIWYQRAMADGAWTFTLPEPSTLPTDDFGFAAWVTSGTSNTPLQVVGGKL